MRYLFLLLLSFNVYAVDPLIEPTTTINCALPTEREDNTPLVAGDIAEVRFYSGEIIGDYQVTNTTAGICQLVIDNTQLSGDLFIVVTAVDKAGRESVYSEVKTHTVFRVKLPKAPTWID